MADKTFNIQIFDGATEFEGSTSNLVRLYKNSTSEYEGNASGAGDFTYQGGAGLWGLGVAEADSGVYIVKKSTDAGGTYTAVEGLDPVPILMKNMLMLAGGTMEGTIDMASNSITNVSSLSFNSESAAIQGISVKNLLDKSATELVTGAWTHSGANTFTGVLNVESASRLQIAGVALDASLTSNDLNMLGALYSASAKVLTNTRASGTVQSAVLTAPTVLTAAMAGLINVDTGGGVVELTLPKISKNNAGAIFIVFLSGHASACTIIANSSDLGFALITGLATTVRGTSILLNERGAFVILMNSGVAVGRWAVLSGDAIAISGT